MTAVPRIAGKIRGGGQQAPLCAGNGDAGIVLRSELLLSTRQLQKIWAPPHSCDRAESLQKDHEVLRIFYGKFWRIWANFDEILNFDMDFKILKICHVWLPYIGDKFWKILKNSNFA